MNNNTKFHPPPLNVWLVRSAPEEQRRFGKDAFDKVRAVSLLESETVCGWLGPVFACFLKSFGRSTAVATSSGDQRQSSRYH